MTEPMTDERLKEIASRTDGWYSWRPIESGKARIELIAALNRLREMIDSQSETKITLIAEIERLRDENEVFRVALDMISAPPAIAHGHPVNYLERGRRIARDALGVNATRKRRSNDE